jgi:competence protein ComEC
MKFIKKVKSLIFVTIILLSLFSYFFQTWNWPISEKEKNGIENDGRLVVHFIDVGQADCILIQLPDGKVSLIDGGNRGDAENVVSYIEKLGIKKIDYLLATHPHEDHIGGLPGVIKQFDIGKIYMPKVSANTMIFETLLTEIEKKNLKITSGKAGINIIDTDEINFFLIAPNSEKYDETNNYSLVARLDYRNNSFLFMGDAEKESEKEIIMEGYNIDVDVLKVGHHGGASSTSQIFLENVSPFYAVISVDKNNNYGHPHKETLERLSKMKVEVLRTDEMGTIIMTSDGNTINIDN